jgi:hypothetical protein
LLPIRLRRYRAFNGLIFWDSFGSDFSGAFHFKLTTLATILAAVSSTEGEMRSWTRCSFCWTRDSVFLSSIRTLHVCYLGKMCMNSVIQRIWYVIALITHDVDIYRWWKVYPRGKRKPLDSNHRTAKDVEMENEHVSRIQYHSRGASTLCQQAWL